MKKIITAINNPKLNEELRKEKNFEIIGKDILYKEAILELLEKDYNINLIIINEKIPGQISLETLIKKIKLINEKIKIIFILEKENDNLEKILLKNNIIDIYYNYKINLKELIKIINKKEINMEEEIIQLKKIIQEKNINYNNIKNNKDNNKIKKLKSKKTNDIKNKESKIITISGNYKSGKSTLALIITKYLVEKNNKVLLIDGDLEKRDLSTILKKEKYKTNKKNKYKKIIKKVKNDIGTKLYNKKNKIYYYLIKSKINLFKIKINKNLYFFNYLNDLLKNKKEDNKKIIFILLKIVKENYNFIIIDLSKNNLKMINKNILEKSDINFLIMEPNLLGIKEIKNLIKIYLDKWKIEVKKIYIIANKKNNNSINKNLISKTIVIKNEICEIKENKYYYILTNNFLKKIFLLKNKNIKKEINNIINKINY